MHHFPWLRNRTTEHRKAGKARNTKENRRSKEFNTVSKQRVEHHSFQRDSYICDCRMQERVPKFTWRTLFLLLCNHWIAEMSEEAKGFRAYISYRRYNVGCANGREGGNGRPDSRFFLVFAGIRGINMV